MFGFVLDRNLTARPIEYGAAGRLAPRFVTDSDVRDLKLRLNPTVDALDKLVSECPDMPDVLVTGWDAFSTSWKAFLQQDESFWSAGAEMDQAEAFQDDIQQWQAKLSKAPCKGSAPAAFAPPAPTTEGKTDESVSDIAGAVKVGAVAVVLVVGAYYADKAGLFGRGRR
jgi:hypothetical protein